MDEMFREMLAVDSAKALAFFWDGLVAVRGRDTVSKAQMLYVSSILAHYSLVSCGSGENFPTPTTLSDIFDRFVIGVSRGETPMDSETMATAGASTLFLNGFFRDQLPRRHSTVYWDQMGQAFYYRASRAERDREKRLLMEGMAASSPSWSLRCHRLRIYLEEERLDRQYLIRPSGQ
ncbi:MAG: hypothetical protein ABL899_00325 [Nitrospira sp.]